ncbi:tyrosine kinase [Pseudobythopirellula maris]|uniref:Tyrosine kinase n=1 Tax=Pseudobythopirellula maris TaxID=2527991 RepID=A0A5C5ZT68_9BACT|nr:Wzz/FepE/Etk N-terminal domain-containing protein [Pseudobythopirellula maris]TWT90245.1 tyrosine kinase [Pseudobythopirellula maris]
MKTIDFWETVFRHKIKVVVIPLLLLGMGALVVFCFPRTYQSEAKLFLKVGRESVGIDPTATGQRMINLMQQGRDSEITSAIDLITSRGLIGKVVDELGPDYVLRGGPAGQGGPEPNAAAKAFQDFMAATIGAAIGAIKSIDPVGRREEAIMRLEESLMVDAERHSAMLVLQYETDTPRGAQEILDTVIDVYQRDHLRIHRNESTLAFFTEQEATLADELDHARNAVQRAKNEIGVASIEARRASLESQLQRVEVAVYVAEQDRSSAAASIEELDRQLADLPEREIASKRQIPNDGADLLRDQLYGLQMRKMDLMARYSETHPLVVAISQQVEQAESVVQGQETVREETVDDINPVHRQLTLSRRELTSKAAGLDAQLTMLAQQKQSLLESIKKLNQDDVRIDRLQRDESLLRTKFFRYADNLEQARIDQALEEQEISSVSIAQPPTLNEKPVSPSKALVGLASIVLAIAGTAATVLGLEQLNHKLRGEADTEQALGLPVLAAVPNNPVNGRVLSHY